MKQVKFLLLLTILIGGLQIMEAQNKLSFGVNSGISMPMGDYGKFTTNDQLIDLYGTQFNGIGFTQQTKPGLFWQIDADYKLGTLGFGATYGQFKHQINQIDYNLPIPTVLSGGQIKGNYYGFGPQYMIGAGKIQYGMVLRAGLMNFGMPNHFSVAYNGKDLNGDQPIQIRTVGLEKTNLTYASSSIKLDYQINKNFSLFSKIDYILTFGKGLAFKEDYYTPIDIDQNDTINYRDVSHFVISENHHTDTRYIKPNIVNIGIGLIYHFGGSKPKIKSSKGNNQKFDQPNNHTNTQKADLKQLAEQLVNLTVKEKISTEDFIEHNTHMPVNKNWRKDKNYQKDLRKEYTDILEHMNTVKILEALDAKDLQRGVLELIFKSSQSKSFCEKFPNLCDFAKTQENSSWTQRSNDTPPPYKILPHDNPCLHLLNEETGEPVNPPINEPCDEVSIYNGGNGQNDGVPTEKRIREGGRTVGAGQMAKTSGTEDNQQTNTRKADAKRALDVFQSAISNGVDPKKALNDFQNASKGNPQAKRALNAFQSTITSAKTKEEILEIIEIEKAKITSVINSSESNNEDDHQTNRRGRRKAKKACLEAGGTFMERPDSWFCMRGLEIDRRANNSTNNDGDENARMNKRKCWRQGGTWVTNSNGSFCWLRNEKSSETQRRGIEKTDIRRGMSLAKADQKNSNVTESIYTKLVLIKMDDTPLRESGIKLPDHPDEDLRQRSRERYETKTNARSNARHDARSLRVSDMRRKDKRYITRSDTRHRARREARSLRTSDARMRTKRYQTKTDARHSARHEARGLRNIRVNTMDHKNIKKNVATNPNHQIAPHKNLKQRMMSAQTGENIHVSKGRYQLAAPKIKKATLKKVVYKWQIKKGNNIQLFEGQTIEVELEELGQYDILIKPKIEGQKIKPFKMTISVDK